MFVIPTCISVWLFQGNCLYVSDPRPHRAPHHRDPPQHQRHAATALLRQSVLISSHSIWLFSSSFKGRYISFSTTVFVSTDFKWCLFLYIDKYTGKWLWSGCICQGFSSLVSSDSSITQMEVCLWTCTENIDAYFFRKKNFFFFWSTDFKFVVYRWRCVCGLQRQGDEECCPAVGRASNLRR